MRTLLRWRPRPVIFSSVWQVATRKVPSPRNCTDYKRVTCGSAWYGTCQYPQSTNMSPRARVVAASSTLAILLVSATVGLWIDWRAPGLARYAQDWLMRLRGPLPVPDDIAIVAIDEPSMARFGRFPWSRQVMARTIDAIAAARPKVIAVNVLFTDPTTQEDDDLLGH